eukprot:Selendium_serpulae@DN6450_c2_g11_i1.p1
MQLAERQYLATPPLFSVRLAEGSTGVRVTDNAKVNKTHNSLGHVYCVDPGSQCQAKESSSQKRAESGSDGNKEVLEYIGTVGTVHGGVLSLDNSGFWEYCCVVWGSIEICVGAL